jgi:RNA polymerase sigma factor (sigma-70 family)
VLTWITVENTVTSVKSPVGQMASSPGNTTQLQALLDKGGPDTYDELITRASDRLLKLTRKMLRNYPHLRRWEATDDVFQTAVMRLHRSLSEVKPESVSHFFGLASTQIRRTLIDLLRHHFGPEGQAAKHESATDHAGPVRNKPDTHEHPETLESWARFHETVDGLPADERNVFQLVWYGGLQQKDVAALLDISIPTVQRRWYRARHLLNNAMSGESLSFDED